MERDLHTSQVWDISREYVDSGRQGIGIVACSARHKSNILNPFNVFRASFLEKSLGCRVMCAMDMVLGTQTVGRSLGFGQDPDGELKKRLVRTSSA